MLQRCGSTQVYVYTGVAGALAREGAMKLRLISFAAGEAPGAFARQDA